MKLVLVGILCVLFAVAVSSSPAIVEEDDVPPPPVVVDKQGKVSLPLASHSFAQSTKV